ncbi:phosphoglucosamine mutase [archaeon]|nr:phosphoglucosamine mutase [archaeon]
MKLFGTDGIRGKANVYPITAEMALKLGKAVGIVFRNGKKTKTKIIIGKDTRLSCYLIESALVAGLVSVGVDAYLVGPMPTPAVAHLTKSFAADAGIVITASHNPYMDNGIKFFDRHGWKIDNETINKIEELTLQENISTQNITGDQIGQAHRIDDARGRYIEFAKNSINNRSLAGIKVVLDCANGAAYNIAKFILKELGAQVITLNASPNGRNINDNCGATHPELIAKEVINHNANCGIALDGDADRIVMVDENGNVLDGDFIIAIAANYLKQTNSLTNNTVIQTVMVNQGFVSSMNQLGIKTIQTKVGDKHVLKKMRELGAVLGGEQSGHIAFLEHCTTGDGMITGLKILDIMQKTQKPLSELSKVMTKFPQVLINLEVKQKPALESLSTLNQLITNAKNQLQDTGKVLVRYSGTQMQLRVMVQGQDKEQITILAQEIADHAKKVINV